MATEIHRTAQRKQDRKIGETSKSGSPWGPSRAPPKASETPKAAERRPKTSEKTRREIDEIERGASEEGEFIHHTSGGQEGGRDEGGGRGR